LIAAVILAAGLSKRMGGPKQILPVEGEPMLGRVLAVFRRSMVGEVVVVLGAEAQQIRETVRFKDEKVVINIRYREGMGSSLRLGIEALGDGTDAAIIALADQPFLSPATVDSIIEAHARTGAPIVVPVYHGGRGNPVLFDRSLFPQMLEVHGDVGAKSVVESHADEVLEVAVDDAGIIFDIDTPDDYNRAAVPGEPT
jgi:molybdenum cofactor cytidylyltransferase